MQRGSRFKAYLVPASKLANEVLGIKPFLAGMPQVSKWSHHELSYFLLTYFLHRAQYHGYQRWCSSCQAQNEANEILQSHNYVQAYQWFCEHRILRVPGAIHEVMFAWPLDQWQLSIADQHFTPVELMLMQAEGRRVVVVDRSCALNGLLVDGQRDAFEFVLHDILHAFHFFRDRDNYLSQVEFYGFMAREYLEGTLASKMMHDPDLRTKMEYVMSDMNTNIHHLRATYEAHLHAYNPTH